jgi:CubicO group peptidase (beta-lactamase class C family)
MSRKLWLYFIAITLSGCGGGDDPSHQADFSQAKATLDGFIVKPGATVDENAASGSVDGYSFAVTDSKGTLYEAAGGNQDVGTVSPIASATKMPSAIAILTLVDAGKLSLDEPVKTYLNALDPSFSWPYDKRNITMRMLLSHTAGIPAPPDPATTDCLSDTFTTLRECAQDIATKPLDYPPGTTFAYSGADYQVAGYVAQLIAGEPFTQLFQNAVATPLGLTTFVYNDNENPRVAGGGSSNVDDYMKILRMILNDGVADNGARILSDAMIQELQRNNTAHLRKKPLSFLSNTAQNYFSGYTLGLFITDPAQYQSDGTSGPEFVDPGLYGTTPWFDMDRKYGAVILITNDTITGLDMWTAVRPKIVSQLQ